jgi:MFS family permease
VISLRRFLSNPAVPHAYRGNFIHLYFDMAWFGILSGTAMNFLSVYAARLGGSGFQIGMLAATSAFVNLILAMPASRVFQKRPVGRTVFWTSVLYRIGYLLWIPLPWLFARQGQIWALIGITLLMGIPLAVQAIGFNALFAAAVPTEWRASVAGTRNMLYSVTYMLSALGGGPAARPPGIPAWLPGGVWDRRLCRHDELCPPLFRADQGLRSRRLRPAS